MPDIASLGIKVDSRDIHKATVELNGFSSAADKAEKEATSLSSSSNKLASSARETGKEFVNLKNAIAGIGAAIAVQQIYAIEKSLISARVEADRLKSSFGNVFGEAQMSSELKYLSDVTDRLGMSFGSTATEFMKFAAAAKGTALEGQQTREIFEAISVAGAKLGLSADQQSGALNALQQMISKGNVAAEELKGQLGERLPGAFQMAAKAMGVTTSELGKMLERGEVLASDLLPKLAKILKEEYGDDGGAVMTAQAQINRLTSAWEKFKQSLADTGTADAGLGVLSGLTSALKDATQAMEKARSLGWGGIGQSLAGIGGGLFGFETPAEEQARLGKQINWLKKEIKSVQGTGQEIYKQSLDNELMRAESRFSALSRIQKIELKTTEQLKRQIEADKNLLEEQLALKEDKGKKKSASQGRGYAKTELSAAQQEIIDAVKQGQRIFEETRTPLEALNAEYDKLNRLLELGAINQDTYNRAISQAQTEYDKATKAVVAWDDSMVKMEKQSSQVDMVIGDAFSSAAEAIANFGKEGQKSFGQMIESMIRDLIRLELQMSMIALYQGKSGGGGIFGDLIGKAIGYFTGSGRIDTSFTTGLGVSSGAIDYAEMSFDGGGFTGTGMRSGGIDGKGGFPAILHPNETVIDHTKGQSSGATVNIYGAPAGTRTKTTKRNGREFIDVFIADLQSGGEMSQAIQGAYKLGRTGR